MRRARFVCFAFYLAFCFTASAQDKPVAFKGALVYTLAGDSIPNGVVVLEKGKIIVVGKAGTAIPTVATIIDATGKIIMPGIIDTHSHLGGPEGGDRSAALNPEVRVLDAVDPASDDFHKALAGGVTTINVMPGSGHLMSGQTVYLKMREGKKIEDLLMYTDKGVYGGMKMANGTNPMRDAANFPGTRAKSAAMARELFIKAQEYQEKIVKAGKDSTKLPDRDLRMEALVEVLQGKRIVHFHTHKENDILTAIRLSKEFGFRLVLHHVSEAWKVADEIGKAKIPCSIINLDAPGGKLEAMNYSITNGAALEKAGVMVAVHTDDPITDSRFLIRSAALSIKGGMSRSLALKALTINGAKMLDLSDKVGSLEVGKDADLIVLSGDPFSVYTHVEQTWVEGVKRFDYSDPKDKAFATGGFRVYEPSGVADDDGEREDGQ